MPHVIITGLILTILLFNIGNAYAAKNININMKIILNQPPNAPTITGPPEGNVGDEYQYNFKTTDPDGDHVYYWIEWGDGTVEGNGWIGPYNSGETVPVDHSWTNQGNYTIRAKAKDTGGAESGWGYLTVTMPVNLQVNQQSAPQSQQQTTPQSQPSGQQIIVQGQTAQQQTIPQSQPIGQNK